MWTAALLTLRTGMAGRMRPGCTAVRAQLYASRVRSVAPEARTARRRTLKEIVMAPAGESAFNLGKGALAGASAIGLGALCFYGLGMSKGIGAVDRAARHHEAAQQQQQRLFTSSAAAKSSSEVTAGNSVATDARAAEERQQQPAGGDGPLQATDCKEDAAAAPPSAGTAGEFDAEDEDVRLRIMRASLTHVMEHGFSEAAVRAGAQSLGLAPTACGLFERGAGAELALFFYRDCNSRFAADVAAAAATEAEPKAKKQPVATALRNAVVARLSLTAPYVGAWPRGMALLASSPSVAQDALACLVEFVDDAWHAAGDASADMGWYTKRAELAAIYKAAELFMLQDTSEDFADTWAFVDRMLSDAAATAGTIAAVTAAASGLGSGAYTALSLAKNVLGLRR